MIFNNICYKWLTTALKPIYNTVLVEYNYNRPKSKMNKPPLIQSRLLPYDWIIAVKTSKRALKLRAW